MRDSTISRVYRSILFNLSSQTRFLVATFSIHLRPGYGLYQFSFPRRREREISTAFSSRFCAPVDIFSSLSSVGAKKRRELSTFSARNVYTSPRGHFPLKIDGHNIYNTRYAFPSNMRGISHSNLFIIPSKMVS